MKEWIKDILFAVVIAVIVIQFVKPTIVKQSSMEPNFYENDYLFVSKQSYTLFGEPERGDVVVVHSSLVQENGEEKMLIKRVMKRQVPSGGLPADVGCVVSNISTTKAISDAIQKGMPLIERVVTVTGEHVKRPGNYIVKIGTNTKDLIDYCGGITGEDVTVKAGGPMMGFVLGDTNVPIMKGSNGIIAVDTDHTAEQPCIKCGRCVDVCPMELSPLYYAKYADEENWQGMKEKNVMDCLECRCCEYICSSKIPLVTKIKAGKNAVRGMK